MAIITLEVPGELATSSNRFAHTCLPFSTRY